MSLKIKTFGFRKNYTRYKKKVGDKIFNFKNLYKFTSGHFLNGPVVFVLIVKNVLKNEKFNFPA